ncbi:MAG TPA: TetR family transcriptional regulator [Streptosporangiaceae bacterium]|jgi:AcrR family transcriptional regulator|nr:TetR family transcriptional regulator [Streptosporangiaceae bacterium]
MTESPEPARRRRPDRARSGRRAGDSGTREAILDAARRQFADRGYDGATIRGIAAEAGVDPALVHHFYGTKERLFAAAMSLPLVPSEVLTAAFAEIASAGQAGQAGQPGRAGMGEQLVRMALTVWESTEVRGVFLGLLRSALTSESAADLFRGFITDAILGPIAAAARSRDPAASADEAAYRAGIVTTQMLGLALSRYVLKLEPVASASHAELAATIGPTLDRYLTGPIASP